MSQSDAAEREKHLAYWEKHASKYDLSLRLLRRPLPRMLELIGEATAGADRVLEVAAGTGLVTPILAERAREVVATDYSGAMLEQLRARVAAHGLSNVRCEQADLYALPYAPRSFDVVVAANVLHIVPDLARAVDELERQLRPGGKLIAPTFCHDETRMSWLMSRLLAVTSFPAHQRFTTSSLAQAMADCGLSVSRSESIPGVIPIGYVECMSRSLLVQLLTFAECPNREPAREVLLSVLRAYPDAVFEEIDVNAATSPSHLRAWGSPTILVNGQDVANQAANGPCCRLYEEHLDGNRGVPSATSIIAAIEKASV